MDAGVGSLGGHLRVTCPEKARTGPPIYDPALGVVMDLSRLHRSVNRGVKRIGRPGVAVAAAATVVLSGAATYAAVAAVHAGPQGDGTSITPTGWHVTPAGRQLTLASCCPATAAPRTSAAGARTI
jgi:hypothetical protein